MEKSHMVRTIRFLLDVTDKIHGKTNKRLLAVQVFAVLEINPNIMHGLPTFAAAVKKKALEFISSGDLPEVAHQYIAWFGEDEAFREAMRECAQSNKYKQD